MEKWKTSMAFLLSVILLLATACGSAKTSSPKKADTGKQESSASSGQVTDFPTKQITWIVPVSPGGSYDTISRITAEYIRKYLPHNVPIAVKNIPGGDWGIGLGAFSNAKPDGYTLSVFNLPANAINQIQGSASYDLKKVEWIGKITSYPLVGLVKKGSNIKTIDDLKKAEKLKVGTVGITSGTGFSIISTLEALGIKNAKLVQHNGSSEAMAALLRGDIDYYPVSLRSAYDTIKKGDVTPLFIFDDKRDSLLPDVPTIKELGYPELILPSNPHTSIGLPSGTPKEIVDIWRDAFNKVINDKDFAKKLENIQAPLIPGDDVSEKKFVDDGFKSMETILQQVNKYQ